MKVICITGTSGTGKTTIAKKLAEKYSFYYLDVNKIISKNKLSEGYDRKRKTKIVDVNKLNKFLINFIEKNKNIECVLLSKARSTKTLKKENITKNKSLNKINPIKKLNGIIIDSHLSHHLPKKYVDLVIVTKCDIKELNKRFKRRKYSKNKIQENLQAEIFDVCCNEALEKKHKVITIDTAKSFNMSKILSLINK